MLKQLIPGNPGTSFVTCLLYVLQDKYQAKVSNEDQLEVFSKGIVKSRKVFFSGVINQICKTFDRRIVLFSNSKYILNLAKAEVADKFIKLEYNPLGMAEIDQLLDKYGYLVLSVDIYQFKNYHDYHFVTISRPKEGYSVFEPKTGSVLQRTKDDMNALVTSVPQGLKDIVIGFAFEN